ncbi:MAG: M4 family metallopeptidase [Candidatus Hydrogenedentes bacterium]|nr:M4 family metallopeptidase [Candidatus Hydrogenedentota bacterium]
MRSLLAVGVQGWTGLALVVFGAVSPLAGAQQANTEPLSALFGSLEAAGATELPVVRQTSEGHVRYVGAPEGAFFHVPGATAKSGSLEAQGLSFFTTYQSAFGVTSASTAFSPQSTRERNGVTYVRLAQTYGGLPVYASQAVVALGASGQVSQVMSDILRDSSLLDGGVVSLDPALTAVRASTLAREAIAGLYSDVAVSQLGVRGAATLMVFDPKIVGLPGAAQLVWRMRIATGTGRPVQQEVLVDAHSGKIALRFSLLHDALDRTIFDADGDNTAPIEPARVEGGGPTGIADVDSAYDFFGDTYDFYQTEHGRDGVDDAGLPIVATVRLPFFNAFWDSIDLAMSIGAGLAVDDVIAHEYTHGVTQFESDLIYFGFSGAMNESFSDIWGEFVDLTNGTGNDSANVRWLIGEDIAGEGDPEGDDTEDEEDDEEPQPTDTNAFRSMSDPTVFGDPDRLGSPLLFNTNTFLDNGGVHINSGIGNKLCYLLTDGDIFNGQTVEGMGISVVADLFYQAQLMLTPASDYNDLYDALGAGASALGLTFEDRLNIAAAGRAVEIEPPTSTLLGLRSFRATPTRDINGNPVVALTWVNPPSDQFENVQLLRQTQTFAQSPNEGTLLFQGTSQEFVDRTVQEGVEYFYTLIADIEGNFPQILFARATGGGEAPIVHTQAFGFLGGTSSNFDLSFKQILYTPVGTPAGGAGGGGLADYEATIRTGITALPVQRGSGADGSYAVPLRENQTVFLGLGSFRFPFFGARYNQLALNANGFITFAPVPLALTLPTLEAHFRVPRISFLFANLLPSASGIFWVRPLDDRLAITFERVAEASLSGPFAAGPTNTVQVELFYSGHIRITYESIGVDNVIAGISDGQGVPVDPADVAEDLLSVETTFDLSELPVSPTQLSLNAVTPAGVIGGGELQFDIEANVPAGLPGTPVLTATWDGPGAVPFADNRDGTGSFLWRTSIADEGAFTVRVVARLGDARAYQDVQVFVGEFEGMPEATNLTLATGSPLEDPAQDRTVDDNDALFAAYDYEHPRLGDASGFFEEGPSILYWFKNGQVVSGLINIFEVPSYATAPGDQWHFRVLPVTVLNTAGSVSVSPTVTVIGGAQILTVTPSVGLVQGGDTVRITGDRIDFPIRVEFGGVRAASIRNLGNSVLEVVTPVHNEGTVDVTVQVAAGPVTLEDAFTFVDPASLSLEITDVNNDGKVDSLDIQMVVEAIMRAAKATGTDVNRDGATNSADVQLVINRALGR